MTVVYNGTARETNKQSSKYPVYQVHYEDGNKIVFAPGDVKFVDLDGDGTSLRVRVQTVIRAT